MKIGFLSGGTGTPKLIQGFRGLVPDELHHVVCNTGDDLEYNTLYISPDFDTLLYLYADVLDTLKFWGVRDETFHTLQMLGYYGEETWFKLGDKDLALHIIRTSLIKQGKSALEIARFVSSKLGVKAHLYPMSNQRVTSLIQSGDREVHFQEFWVKERGKAIVDSVRFLVEETAEMLPEAAKAMRSSTHVVIGPSNPVTSIGPILAIRGYKELLTELSKKLWIFSPIIGKAPVSGPAAQLMRSRQIEVSSTGIASCYSDFQGAKFILDEKDRDQQKDIEDMGFEVMLANTLMNTLDVKRNLARMVLENQ